MNVIRHAGRFAAKEQDIVRFEGMTIKRYRTFGGEKHEPATKRPARFLKRRPTVVPHGFDVFPNSP